MAFQNVGNIDICCPVKMIRHAVRLRLTLDVLDPECEGEDVEGRLDMSIHPVAQTEPLNPPIP